MLIQETIKWIGRSLPEALCVFTFIYIIAGAKFRANEILLHSSITSLISIVMSFIIPAQAIYTKSIFYGVYAFILLVNKKNVSIKKSVTAIISNIAVLFITYIFMLVVMVNMLGVDYQAITAGEPTVIVTSTVPLIMVYLPAMFAVKKYRCKTRSKLIIVDGR